MHELVTGGSRARKRICRIWAPPTPSAGLGTQASSPSSVSAIAPPPTCPALSTSVPNKQGLPSLRPKLLLCTREDTGRGPQSHPCPLYVDPSRCGNCSPGSTPHSPLPTARVRPSPPPPRPSWCPLERPGQSGTCVSEPWQAPIQSKCLSWFLPGLGPGAAVVLPGEAGLAFRIPGMECLASLSLAV